jgi:hypothetical protein
MPRPGSDARKRIPDESEPITTSQVNPLEKSSGARRIRTGTDQAR